ncbi:MAG: tRNA 2-thiouridine(34) synthase MnmA [bacterium]|nr:tRNA 2-thiouridine(34) synthase MnmA [bacterium]
MRTKEKISVALSGGVDSSVAAAILLEEGFEVSGFSLILSDPQAEKDISIAEECAKFLGIPFETIDLRNEFHREIMKYFIDEYRSGRTPNPCIKCNRVIKFGELLFKRVEKFSGKIATGHYAVIEHDEKNNRFLLKKGFDKKKDQSYFLSTLNQEQLSRVIFPVGKLKKTEVKDLARKLKLPSRNSKESNELCFIPEGHYSEYIRETSGLNEKEGNIEHVDGRLLGKHTGIINYTIGQRKGMRIAWSEPLYVIAIIPDENKVIAGEEKYLYSKRFIVENFFIVNPEYEGKNEFPGEIKIRYLNDPTPGRVQLISGNRTEILLDKAARAITPGQHACVYSGDVVIGGGTITENIKGE